MSTLPSLPTADTERGLRLVIREGMATQSMIILTSGALLVALALKLGATHFQIGVITSIPLFANVCQIASIYLVQRWQHRKRVVVWCTTLGRAAYLLIALLPFVDFGQSGIYVIMLALAVQHCLGAVSNGSWSSWMRDLVPHRTMGAFFSRRLAIVQTISIFLSIGTMLLIDRAEVMGEAAELYLYGGLFFVGSLAGLVGSYFLSRTPEPAYQPKVTPLLSLVKLPFRHTNFRKLMAYMASWNFAVNLATPFFTVYLLERLGLSMAYVIGFTTLIHVFNVMFFQHWGRYADRYSNKTVLSICAPLYLLCIVGIAFTTLPEVYAGTLPLLIALHALMGVATAGTGLAAGNIGLKLAPQEHSVAYLSMLSFTNSLAAGVAPILSGWLSGFLVTASWSWTIQGVESTWFLISLRHWDFLFAASFAMGGFALYRLYLLEEVGSVSRQILLSRWGRELRLWGQPQLRARIKHTRNGGSRNGGSRSATSVGGETRSLSKLTVPPRNGGSRNGGSRNDGSRNGGSRSGEIPSEQETVTEERL